MATEIRSYTCLVPAGTLSTAPANFDVSFPPRVVDFVQVIVPAGPSGLVGWHLMVGGVTVIPYLSDTWVITSGENITWPLEEYPDAGSWSVQAYNTGINDHALYFRFGLSNLVSVKPKPSVIPDDQLALATG